MVRYPQLGFTGYGDYFVLLGRAFLRFLEWALPRFVAWKYNHRSPKNPVLDADAFGSFVKCCFG